MKQLLCLCTLVFNLILFAGVSSQATNYSLRFDGADDYVSVDQQIYFGESYTIECWFRVEATGSDKCLLTTFITSPSLGNYIYLGIQSNGTVRFVHRVPASQSASDGGNLYSPLRYDDNVWHHLAAVYNNSNRTMYLYIDGNLKASSILSTTWGKPINNNSTVYIGKNATWDSRWFERYIDELRIWNTPRNQTQIQNYMCHELIGTETDFSDLNLYFKFNEGSGIYTYDSKNSPAKRATLNSVNTPNWWYAGFAATCNIYQDKMALWLDPFDINGNGTNPLTNTLLSSWVDKTVNKENALMADVNRKPIYKTDGIIVATSPSVKKPGVQFSFDYGQTKYGFSDILESRYDPEITSGVNNIWNPSNTNKTLFVIFQTGSDVDQDLTGETSDPYYSDGRQTIFEAGGPLSGYNIYLSQGKLCFGMWNRFERKYIMAENSADLYPLGKNKVYIAILEFKNGKFRGILGGYKRTATSPPAGVLTTMYSLPLDFKGLSNDPNYPSDNTGIGGATRTAYHDYNTGETYSDHFGGTIGDVILYNNLYNGGEPQDVINYLIHKYDLLYTTAYPLMPAKQGDKEWKYFDYSNNLQEVLLSTAYPNPFIEKTGFALNLPSAQYIRVEVLDVYGNTVATLFNGTLPAGMHDFVIDGSGLASGMYIFRAIGDGFQQSGKVILSK